MCVLISESSSELASSSDPINLRMSENGLEDLSRQTMIVRGLHNPLLNVNNVKTIINFDFDFYEKTYYDYRKMNNL